MESQAWAKLTTGGDVDMEFVFWPSLSQAVVDEATTLAATLADPAGRASFVAKLPGGKIYRDAGVVIHHSDPSVRATPIAYATFDAVTDPWPNADVRHFDSTGAEFRLPYEVSTPSPAAGRGWKQNVSGWGPGWSSTSKFTPSGSRAHSSGNS